MLKKQFKHIASVLFIYFFTIFYSNAQNETNVWFFGNKLGLDFNNGAKPKGIYNNYFSNDNGVAVICNPKGKPLFYSNGENVYTTDTLGTGIMDNGNGLLGLKGSTQAAFICPRPGKGKQYYLFTTRDDGGGLYYNIIDTSLNSGKGRVSIKNRVLLSNSTQRVTIVQHANTTDLWVIAHQWGTDSFYAWRLSAKGFVDTVISEIGFRHSGNINNGKGYLKGSPDGKRLAMSTWGLDRFDLFDFDNSTGIISNNMVLKHSSIVRPVGVEFSPNGRYLYGCSLGGVSSPLPSMYQFDLNITTDTAMMAAARSMRSPTILPNGAMQTGPDGKIYVAIYSGLSVGVIFKPDSVAKYNGSFDDAYVGYNKSCKFGLPQYLPHLFFKPKFKFSSICLGDTTNFILMDTALISKVRWDFGDISLISDTSNQFSSYYIYKKDTSYMVKLIIIYRNGHRDTSVQRVRIFSKPVVDLGHDTTLCSGTFFPLGYDNPKYSYTWDNGGVSPNYQPAIKSSGSYSIEVMDGTCITKDTVKVEIIDVLKPKLGRDTMICEGYSILKSINNGQVNVKYLWSNNISDSIMEFDKSGIYSGTISIGKCSNSDTFSLIVKDLPLFSLGKDTVICEGEKLEYSFVKGQKYFLWNDSTISNFKVLSIAGQHSLTIIDSGCSFSDSINLSTKKVPSLDLGRDSLLCEGDSMILEGSIPNGISYEWNNGKFQAVINANKTNTYALKATDGVCTVSDSVYLSFRNKPDLFIGDDTVSCYGDSIDFISNISSPDFLYKWNNDPIYSQKKVFRMANSNRIICNATDFVCHLIDTLNINLSLIGSYDVIRDTVICENETLDVSINKPGILNYLWQDGSISNSNLFSFQGTYWVKLMDKNCSVIDTFSILKEANFNPELGVDTNICDNQLYKLKYQGIKKANMFFTWYQNDIPFANYDSVLIGKVRAGEIKLIIYNTVCINTDSVNVSFTKSPVLDLGGDKLICGKDTLIIDAENPESTYLWDNGDTNRILRLFNDSNLFYRSQKLSIIANNNNCFAYDTVSLIYSDKPLINLIYGDSVLCSFFNIILNQAGNDIPGTKYMWNTGEKAKTISPISKGYYALSAQNLCGAAFEGINISINQDKCIFYLPDAFTPNGNGINEVFVPIGNLEQIISFEVYNRWGELMHKETKDYGGGTLMGWDGRIKEDITVQGIYFYIIKYNIIVNGVSKTKILKGSLIVLL
jgi:gliding motility-associated-like protein